MHIISDKDRMKHTARERLNQGAERHFSLLDSFVLCKNANEHNFIDIGGERGKLSNYLNIYNDSINV